MKKIILLSFLFCSSIIFSQVKISGKILDENNESLEGASVYLNNTTIRITTEINGEFELTVKEGIYDLIVTRLFNIN